MALQAESDVAEAVNVISELKRRLKEQSHEMASYKVDAENKAGKVRAHLRLGSAGVSHGNICVPGHIL